MLKLPPCCPVCPSDPLPFLLSPLTFPFPLIFVFHGSSPVFHPAPKHLSYLTSGRFLPVCSGFYLPNFSFVSFSFSFFFIPPPPFLLSLPLTSSSLSVHQDKLSEELQKQHDGPEESGSPPATRTEPDTGPPPNADPDASQAEEDKDTTKPLLERLKALEVTTAPPPPYL